MGAQQMKFCGAVARALLIGVRFGGLDGVRVGSRSKMGKLQMSGARRDHHRFWYNTNQKPRSNSMHNTAIVFIEANVARLFECPMPEPNSGEVRVRGVRSCISSGTVKMCKS